MKTKTKRLTAVVAVIVLALVAILSAGLMCAGEEHEGSEAKAQLRTGLASSEIVDIVVDENTQYALIYSSDSYQGDQQIAKELDALITAVSASKIRPVPDTAAEKEFEILIGATDRAFSKELLAEVNEISSDSLYVWAYAYKDGKLAFVANSPEGYNVGKKGFLALVSEDGTLSVPSDLYVFSSMTHEEYDEMLRAEEEANKQQMIQNLIDRNNQFTQSQFGGDPLEMPTNLYESPHTYPTANQHPKYFVTAENLDELRYDFLENPDYEQLRKTIYSYANKVRGDAYTGEFPVRDAQGTRFDTDMLAQLEAKAFVYLMTGDVSYGYEAIIGAKNAMLSVHYTTALHMDVYHGPSQVMVNVAKVYDWCYDLLTEDDKNQIIAGVSNVLAPQMESGMRFPPTGLNAVIGHGTGPQFIRDWLTVAIVFYDEMPSWWELVGGRYYEEYVPVIDLASENGWASQGTVTYGDSKAFTRSWAAYLVTIATGEFPYNYEDFSKVAYYYFSYIQPNGKYFQTGDGGRYTEGYGIGDSCTYMMLMALMFQDPTIGAMAKYYTEDYTKFSYAFTTELTAPDMFIFRSLGPEIKEERGENIGIIQYLEAPAATMTARTSWDEDAAAVLMRMGTKTMSNHDLADHGTFQIYYKGLLAGTSGAYKQYNSNAHRYYLKATVAHNGLLVFDPSKADAEPVWNCSENHEHDTTTCAISNAGRYYYSGSQRFLSDPSSIETWTGGQYDMGDMLGASYEYNRDGTGKYAYIATDLTKAYPSDTVEFLSRRMLTLYTGNEEMPLLFFTYDTMVGKGEDYTKSWLLHTVQEPTIDEEKLTATVIQEGGRLVMHSLSGATAISKVGGEGKHFWINGKNCQDTYHDPTADYCTRFWGRIELTTTGNLADTMLTAMYVTDADSTETLEITSAKNEYAEYAKILDKFVVFTNTKAELQSKEFSFTTEGTGLYEYYISGLEAGSWHIYVDGIQVATVVCDEGEGFARFTAPTGEVSVKPGEDVLGSNGGRIKYNLSGGLIEGKYPVIYKNDVVTPLPTVVTKGESIFSGWYTSPSFEPETRVTEIPVGYTGTFYVYAKWLGNLLSVDYTDTSKTVNVTSGAPQRGVVTYATNNGGTFITETDDDGVQYLEWKRNLANSNSQMSVANTTQNLSTMTADDECATFTVTFAKGIGGSVPTTQFRVYSRKDPRGNTCIARQCIFTTNTKGEIRLGNSSSGPIAGYVTDDKITLRIVLDFKNEELRAYDAYGNVTAKTSVSVSELTGTHPGVETMSEWRKLLNQYLMFWCHMSSGTTAEDALRVYSIKIDEGDRYRDFEPTDGMIVYNTNGYGELPSNAPVYYSTEAATKLPALSNISGSSVFLGWYTTPDFKDGTEVTEVPADTTGVYNVYARGISSILNENYANSSLELTEGSQVSGLVEYKVNGITGSYFKTQTDSDGKKYLSWCDAGGAGSNPFIVMTNGAIANAISPYISYKLTFSKDANAPLNTFYFRTLAQHDVNGTKLSDSNSVSLFKVLNDGIYLSNTFAGTEIGDTDVKIGDITDGKMTVRVLLDFAECKVKAYDDKGSLLGEMAFEIPESSGAADGIEFQKCFKSYVFYMMSNTASDVLNSTVNIHEMKIYSGNAFTPSSLDGQLSYVTDGGTLPENAPAEYSKEVTTALPTPAKPEYEFLGWYTDPYFDETTKLTEISPDTVGAVTVYAKWKLLNTIVYNLNGGTLPADAPLLYSNTQATTLPTPERAGYIFKGWYTTDTFEHKTDITEIPTSEEGKFYIYAKWEEIHVPVDGRIIYDTMGGTLTDGAPTSFNPGADGEIQLPVPTKDGYEFGGWFTTPDLASGTGISVIPAGAVEEVMVYANWIKTVYSENFNDCELKADSNSEFTVGALTVPKGGSCGIKEDANGDRYLSVKYASNKTMTTSAFSIDGENKPSVYSVQFDLVGENIVSSQGTLNINYVGLRFMKDGDADTRTLFKFDFKSVEFTEGQTRITCRFILNLNGEGYMSTVRADGSVISTSEITTANNTATSTGYKQDVIGMMLDPAVNTVDFIYSTLKNTTVGLDNIIVSEGNIFG